MKIIDMTGKVIGKLTILKRGESINGVTVWNYKCECGKFGKITSMKLRWRERWDERMGRAGSLCCPMCRIPRSPTYRKAASDGLRK